MPKIFDSDGNEIADFPLSEKMLAALDADEEIAMIFHTPRMHQGTLGHQSGSFTLRKIGARVVAVDAGTVRKYAAIQQAVMKARGLE
jgi:hypothetical protein